ncbi:MAG: hypothetical protein K940chlam9_00036 [Chlamydiae bacterium]|nr:hypothetical protein [Chlamydiota bacterium]
MRSKYILSFIFLTVMLLAKIAPSYAECIVFCSEEEKVYVEQEQIFFENEAIFINTPEGIVEVQGIFQDDQGIFYLKPTLYWTCKKCGYSGNPAWTKYCQNCKKRYNE